MVFSFMDFERKLRHCLELEITIDIDTDFFDFAFAINLERRVIYMQHLRQ
jgi:hypothetical protein